VHEVTEAGNALTPAELVADYSRRVRRLAGGAEHGLGG
jgi:hypothetical protein